MSGPGAVATLISDLVHNGLHVNNMVNKNVDPLKNKSSENEKTVAIQTAEVLGRIIRQIQKENGAKAPVALELTKLRVRQLEIARSGTE